MEFPTATHPSMLTALVSTKRSNGVLLGDLFFEANLERDRASKLIGQMLCAIQNNNNPLIAMELLLEARRALNISHDNYSEALDGVVDVLAEHIGGTT